MANENEREQLRAELREAEGQVAYWSDPHRVSLDGNLAKKAAQERARELRARIRELEAG